jgi:hypothetical protein
MIHSVPTYDSIGIVHENFTFHFRDVMRVMFVLHTSQ